MESAGHSAHSADEALSERLLQDEGLEAVNSAHQGSASRPRLTSLDFTRGVTISLMLFVRLCATICLRVCHTLELSRFKGSSSRDVAFIFCPLQVNHSGSTPWWIPHAAWNGAHLADFVMPAFLVIMGASISLSLVSRRQSKSSPSSDLAGKIMARTLKLFLMGLFIQGGVASGRFPSFDLSVLRIMGILQRIAVCYFVMSMSALFILPKPGSGTRGPQPPDVPFGASEPPGPPAVWRPSRHSSFIQLKLWGTAAAVLISYSALTLTAPVPNCTVPAISSSCNLASWLDSKILRPQHMYPFPSCRSAEPPCHSFDPEGLFTSLGGAMSSTALGVAVGYQLTAHQLSLAYHLALPGLLLIVSGLLLHFVGFPLNKNLYSGSFVLLTTGVTILLLTVAYWLIDRRRSAFARKLSRPFVWLGANPIAIFFGDEVLEMALPLVYWKRPDNNLRDWLWRALIARMFGTGTAGWLIGAVVDVVFWTCVAFELFRRGIYVKV